MTKQQITHGIISLKAENIKRLRAVEITPQGNMIEIRGRNGQGKSSVLDSIVMALGGKKTHPDKPIRDGETNARVELKIHGYTILRTFTEGGNSYLTVKNEDGAKFGNGQEVLDGLIGKLSFDPLAFTKLDANKQAEELRALVGIDTAGLDAKRRELYEERRIENAATKECESQLRGIETHDDVGTEERSASELLQKIEDLDAQNRHRREVEQRAVELQDKVTDIDREIERLQEQRQALIERKDETLVELEGLDEVADLTPLREQLQTLEATNLKARDNARHAQIEAKRDEHAETAEGLTKQIDAIDEQKAAMLRDAEYPIDGLGFDEEGRVTYQGVPFAQSSSAEQIRVSMAIGLAMNPKLRIVLIREGSLLDEDALKLVADMAREHEAQVFLERVGEGDGEGCQVIIEDGAVKGGAS
ncbi:MAG: AAA family ATPase [Phycisphaerales bacterium]